jgi:hypothetical protein
MFPYRKHQRELHFLGRQAEGSKKLLQAVSGGMIPASWPNGFFSAALQIIFNFNFA